MKSNSSYSITHLSLSLSLLCNRRRRRSSCSSSKGFLHRVSVLNVVIMMRIISVDNKRWWWWWWRRTRKKRQQQRDDDERLRITTYSATLSLYNRRQNADEGRRTTKAAATLAYDTSTFFKRKDEDDIGDVKKLKVCTFDWKDSTYRRKKLFKRGRVDDVSLGRIVPFL